MTKQEMMEMMEFFEMYEEFKARKKAVATESARNTALAVSANNVNTLFDNHSFVQRQDDVVETSKTSKDVPTKYEVVKCGESFRIKHNIIFRWFGQVVA